MTSDFEISKSGVTGEISVVPNMQNADGCCSFMKENNYSSLWIRAKRGFENESVEFIKQIDFDFKLVIEDARKLQLAPAFENPNLVKLQIGDKGEDFSIGKLVNLVEYRGDWHSGLFEAGLPGRLKNLYIVGIRKPQSDLSFLPESDSVESLSIVDSRSLKTLNGLAAFSSLKKIELSYLPFLSDISEFGRLLNLESVEDIFIQKCGNVIGHKHLGVLVGLTKLFIHDAGIDNLKFISRLKSLQRFRFMNTNIIDGDLGPIVHHPKLDLKSVCFTNKKHFSHSLREITEYKK